MKLFKKIFFRQDKVRDVVCGMKVQPRTSEFLSLHEGKEYVFCSQQCKELFDADPSNYGDK